MTHEWGVTSPLATPEGIDGGRRRLALSGRGSGLREYAGDSRASHNAESAAVDGLGNVRFRSFVHGWQGRRTVHGDGRIIGGPDSEANNGLGLVQDVAAGR